MTISVNLDKVWSIADHHPPDLRTAIDCVFKIHNVWLEEHTVQMKKRMMNDEMMK